MVYAYMVLLMNALMIVAGADLELARGEETASLKIIL